MGRRGLACALVVVVAVVLVHDGVLDFHALLVFQQADEGREKLLGGRRAGFVQHGNASFGWCLLRHLLRKKNTGHIILRKVESISNPRNFTSSKLRAV